MDSDRWRPLDPVRSWRFGVHIAAATSAVLGLSLLIGGARSPLAWGLVAGSGGVAALGYRLDAHRIMVRPAGWLVQYLWSVVGLVAAGAFALATGGGPFRYALVFVVAAVAAAGSYPPLGQWLYQALVLSVIVVVWLLSPGDVALPELLLFLGLVATVIYMIGALAQDIQRSLVEEARVRSTVDDRNRLLGMVGRAVSLDAGRALGVIVDTVIASGFEIANVGVIRDGVRHAVATRGLDGPIPPTPVATGIAGRALAEDRTIVVEDYRSDPARLPHRDAVRSAVATPIRVDGEVAGVLIGARTEPGTPVADDVEMLEVLALHAGHALAAAHRFEDEQRVVERLRELDQMKRDFVSNVSHELRTPLTVVKGLARTLEMRQATFGPERTQELLDRINANTQRLGAMLGGLLDFTRLEAGELRVELRPVELGALVREVIARFGPVLEQHELQFDLPPYVLAVADPPLVEHVLENLLGNVAKHTPPGTQVVLEVVRVDDTVRISVRDTGPGIPAEEIPMLTRRYYRGRRHDDGAVEGAGVGLALVHDILQAHGTSLEVQSDEGRGTTFSFWLPAFAEVTA